MNRLTNTALFNSATAAFDHIGYAWNSANFTPW